MSCTSLLRCEESIIHTRHCYFTLSYFGSKVRGMPCSQAIPRFYLTAVGKFFSISCEIKSESGLRMRLRRGHLLDFSICSQQCREYECVQGTDVMGHWLGATQGWGSLDKKQITVIYHSCESWWFCCGELPLDYDITSKSLYCYQVWPRYFKYHLYSIIYRRLWGLVVVRFAIAQWQNTGCTSEVSSISFRLITSTVQDDLSNVMFPLVSIGKLRALGTVLAKDGS